MSMKPVDRKLLYTTAFLRALATGLAGVLLGVYLAQLKLSPSSIGFVTTAGLAGGAVSAVIVTLIRDRWSRRKQLIILGVLTAAGGVLASLAPSSSMLLGIIAFFGMLNGMGRDRGASLIIEQAILPATTTPERRTQTFAWYNVLQDSGHALGGLAAGIPVILTAAFGMTDLGGGRVMMLVYALAMLATAFVYLWLSPAVEEGVGKVQIPVTPQTKKVVTKLSSLFLIDALGGGFLTTTLLSYFFFERFGVGLGWIGPLFFAARVLNAFSHLGAAWLAKKIGLVNTMVFTHIPSSLFLATVAFAPTFTIAAILFLLREGLVEMDVPTRQSYVMAVVKPEERTYASGVTHIVRLAGWAISPSLAGMAMQGVSLVMPLVTGAGLKIAYDFILFFSFRGIKPPEEV
jgi:MFS family permease